jgi:small redox-active disulfide protein 2
VEIKIYGHGCDKCAKMYETVLELMSEKGIDANVEKVESLMDIYKAGVMTTPAMSIDGKLVYASNALPSRKKLESLLFDASSTSKE